MVVRSTLQGNHEEAKIRRLIEERGSTDGEGEQANIPIINPSHPSAASLGEERGNGKGMVDGECGDTPTASNAHIRLCPLSCHHHPTLPLGSKTSSLQTGAHRCC